MLGWDPRASTLGLMVPQTGLVDAAAAASAMSPVPAPGGAAAAAVGTMAESKGLDDFLFGGWSYDVAEVASVVARLAVVQLALASPKFRGCMGVAAGTMAESKGLKDFLFVGWS